MKKKIFSITFLAIAIGGLLLVENANRNVIAQNELFLENVEALSQGETETQCSANANCLIGDISYGSVSCSGRKSCESGLLYVKCDGMEVRCTLSVAPSERDSSKVKGLNNKGYNI